MRNTILVALFCFLPSIASATWVTGTVAELQKTTDGRLVAVVVLRDDKGNSEKFSFSGDLVGVRAAIVNELARRNAAESVIDVLVGTVIALPTPPVITPPVITPPTDDDLAATAFQLLVNAWRSALAEFQAGLAQQSDVDAARAALASPFSKANAALKARFDLVLIAASKGSAF